MEVGWGLYLGFRENRQGMQEKDEGFFDDLLESLKLKGLEERGCGFSFRSWSRFLGIFNCIDEVH